MNGSVSDPEMWLLKTFDQLFAISIVITLLLELSTCYGSEYGVLGEIIYSREFLISLRTASAGIIPDILVELCRLHARSKHRKRGRRGGLHRRLKNLRLDNRRKLPPLPTILLSNVQSLRHKTDELEAWIKCKPGIRDTCLLAFSETWLRELDRDEDLILSGFGSPIRLDRDPMTTGKSRGGGVCLYVNKRYCNTVVVRERICTSDIELLTVSLRPFYLPREFQQLFYTLVYIHPRANASIAAQVIADVTHRLDSICPEAPKFFIGDFNHCTLDKTLRSYEQYITCSTTQRNTTLDLCYGSVNGAYRSMAMPPLDASYHNSIYLMPVYKPAFRRLEREEKNIKLWTEDSISSLQGCLECTDWTCFYDTCNDINEITETMSAYVKYCVDMIIPSKKVVIYPNNKPWVTKELKSVINRKKKTFYLGDLVEKKAVSREVKNEIR